MKYKHLFGPVPSRRLGVSLGVDIVSHKTCNLDCVYCECGKTTNLTCERKEYVDSREVISEIKDILEKGGHLDFITLSGWGEPTLNSKIGYIISEVKKMTDTAVCVITNGTMFYDESVIADLEEADVVMPNLDWVTENSMNKIGRPASDLVSIDKIIDGLVNFRKRYHGKLWLEIFIIEGINDSDKELALLQDAIKRIRPDKIQLNSLDRPSTEKWVVKAGIDALERVKEKLGFENTEIISKYKERESIKGYSQNFEELIMNMIGKRPCTLEDLTSITGKERTEINKYLDILEKEKKIKTEIGERGIFIRYIDRV